MSDRHDLHFILFNHKMNDVLESRLIRIAQVGFRSCEFTFGKPSWILLDFVKDIIDRLPELCAQTLALRIKPKCRFGDLVNGGRENANSH